MKLLVLILAVLCAAALWKFKVDPEDVDITVNRSGPIKDVLPPPDENGKRNIVAPWRRGLAEFSAESDSPVKKDDNGAPNKLPDKPNTGEF